MEERKLRPEPSRLEKAFIRILFSDEKMRLYTAFEKAYLALGRQVPPQYDGKASTAVTYLRYRYRQNPDGVLSLLPIEVAAKVKNEDDLYHVLHGGWAGYRNLLELHSG